MSNILSIEEIKSLKPESYCLFDCRFSLSDADYGRSAYQGAHIPGAIYAHLNEDLSGTIIPGKTGRHPLPEKSAFEAKVRNWGLGQNQLAIIYDDGNGAFAARLWWMLRWLGHGKVAVLNGGLKAWQDSGQTLTAAATRIKKSTFKSSEAKTRLIDAAELLGHVANNSVDGSVDGSAQLTDARDPIRFSGKAEPIDPVAGHIPGAQCLPFTSNLSPTAKIKSPQELREQFLAFGLSPSEATICYCGSGVTAAHNILALVYAGFPEPILYAGSWSEWITDPKRPIALDQGA